MFRTIARACRGSALTAPTKACAVARPRAHFHASAIAMRESLYDVLGVSQTADGDEIKRAYYKLAKEYHPDRNKGKDTEKRFAAINAAYEVLKDEAKRARYDRTGEEDAHEAQQAEQHQRMQDIMSGIMFGGGGLRRAGPPRGADVQANGTVTFMEAVTGVEKEISYNALSPCSTCNGTGSKDKTAAKKCAKCRGSGMVTINRGPFIVQTECPLCRGQGVSFADPCKSCRTSGVVKAKQKIAVRIPAGVDSRTIIRVAGKGDAGERGGPPGSLIVQCIVGDHPRFRREKSDVHVDIPLTLTQALLGGKINVPTLEGDADIEVEPGVQPDDQRVIRSKGIIQLNRGVRGDMIYHFRVALPRRLSQRQRELIEQYRREETTEGSSGSDASPAPSSASGAN